MVDRYETLQFGIDGEWFTNLVRSLWADEGEPDKALRIMKSAFPDAPESFIIDILTGKKKLVGDSRKELLVGPDDVEKSACGNDLSVEAVFSKMRGKLEKETETLANVSQMLAGDTVFVASKSGRVEIPRRAAKDNDSLAPFSGLRNEVDLDSIPHREAPVMRKPEGFWPSKLEDDGEWTPPVGSNEITSDTGWLSPEGKFHGCGYMGHIELARDLEEDEIRLEKKGWVKLQNNDLTWDHSGRFMPTQRQIDLVFDWFRKQDKPMPKDFVEFLEE